MEYGLSSSAAQHEENPEDFLIVERPVLDNIETAIARYPKAALTEVKNSKRPRTGSLKFYGLELDLEYSTCGTRYGAQRHCSYRGMNEGGLRSHRSGALKNLKKYELAESSPRPENSRRESSVLPAIEIIVCV